MAKKQQNTASINIYLDNNSTTPLDKRAHKKMHEIAITIKGNPHSSEHSVGWKAEQTILESQAVIANFINALTNEIIFTSGATESNNLAIIGTAITAQKKKINRKKILVSEIEHKCVLNSAKFLQDIFDFEIIQIPVESSGIINVNALKRMIDNTVLLVSVMAVNNEIGTQQPITKIGEICQKNGVVFHVDGAQSAYFCIDVVRDNIDLLSLSAHKMYGPKGIGILYINSDCAVKPTSIMQGGEQQEGYRSGTLSPALITGMAESIKILQNERELESRNLKNLRNLFLQKITEQGVKFIINGDMNERHPGNLNLQLNGIDSKMLITRLQPKLAFSTGSACSSGTITPSYVLRAIGLSQEEAESSIRLSFGRTNTEEDVLIASKMIADEIEKILNTTDI